MVKRALDRKSVLSVRTALLGAAMSILFCTATPSSALCDDKLLVKNEDGETTFRVQDNGTVMNASRLCTNGASAWGSAPFVLGQDLENRGVVITDKAEKNKKNIYFGWNVGTSHQYAEIFALQEGIEWKNLVLNPYGGYLGIRTTQPRYMIDTGGAYCDGFTWVNASSREYKKDIKDLTRDEAVETLVALKPVSFRYKKRPEKKYLGFIAEDVPDLVATKDRKGLSSIDIVAVLTRVVQEQRATIDELSRRLAIVEKRGAK